MLLSAAKEDEATAGHSTRTTCLLMRNAGYNQHGQAALSKCSIRPRRLLGDTLQVHFEEAHLYIDTTAQATLFTS